MTTAINARRELKRLMEKFGLRTVLNTLADIVQEDHLDANDPLQWTASDDFVQVEDLHQVIENLRADMF